MIKFERDFQGNKLGITFNSKVRNFTKYIANIWTL